MEVLGTLTAAEAAEFRALKLAADGAAETLRIALDTHMHTTAQLRARGERVWDRVAERLDVKLTGREHADSKDTLEVRRLDRDEYRKHDLEQDGLL